MAAVSIAMVSQKGGVGKSTLARLVAREYANAGWSVKISDLDISQATTFNWQGRRLKAGLENIGSDFYVMGRRRHRKFASRCPLFWSL